MFLRHGLLENINFIIWIETIYYTPFSTFLNSVTDFIVKKSSLVI